MINGYPYNITFYSSKTLLVPDSNSLVLVSDLKNLGDLTSFTIGAGAINYKEVPDGDTIKGPGGSQASLQRVYGEFTINTDHFRIKSASDMNSYFDFMKNILRKPAKYMTINAMEYPARFELFGDTSRALSVIFTEVSYDEQTDKVIHITAQTTEPRP